MWTPLSSWGCGWRWVCVETPLHTQTHHRFTLISSVCAMAHVTNTKLGTKVDYHSNEEDAEHGKRRLKVCASLPSPPSLPFLPTLSHAMQAMILSETNSNSPVLVHKNAEERQTLLHSQTHPIQVLMVRLCSVWPTLSFWCIKFQIERPSLFAIPSL